MITTCVGCQQKYRLDASKVPERLINVRCPQCSTVFLLDGTRRDIEEPAETAPKAPAAGVEAFDSVPVTPATPDTAPEAVQETALPEVTSETASEVTPEAAPEVTSEAAPEVAPETAPEVAPSVATTPAPAAQVAADETSELGAAAVAVETEAAPKRRRRDKTEMLARALVSDILVYNQDARDKALAEGNLLEVLGPEIKKSWELYKEKVTPEVANSTTHFRDALNAILADGQKIF